MGAIGFLYLLYQKPEIIVVLFFTMTIAEINFDIPQIPVKPRAIIGILLLLRSFINKSKKNFLPFLSVSANRFILFYFSYLLLVSWGTGSLNMDVTKMLFLSFITAYIGYYSFSFGQNNTYIKLGLICASIICFSDLAYTYIYIKHFPVERILWLISPPDPDLDVIPDNHNFFGFVCGIGFILMLSDYIYNRLISKYLILLMPIMFLGVLMSTSRSTLLGLIIVTAIIIYIALKSPENVKRVHKITGIIGSLIAIIIILFISLQSFLQLESKFIDDITLRLTEEPIAIIQKKLGYNYNVHSLDAGDWREESASVAFDAYKHLELKEQFFGIGIGAFLQRNLAHNGLNPHNGILYLLIETGFLGLMCYMIFLFTTAYNSFKKRIISSLTFVFFYTFIYSLNQNEVLISASTLLFISGIIGENSKQK